MKLNEITKPEPTMAGVCRKTNDPFRWMGKIADAMGEAYDKDKSQYTKPAGASGRSASIDIGSLHKSNSNIKVSVSDGELNTMTPAESP